MKLFLQSTVTLMTVFMPLTARADFNLLERLLFSDRSYAKEIEVKAYIVTGEQARGVLSEPPEQPIQLDKKDLIGKKNIYLSK